MDIYFLNSNFVKGVRKINANFVKRSWEKVVRLKTEKQNPLTDTVTRFYGGAFFEGGRFQYFFAVVSRLRYYSDALFTKRIQHYVCCFYFFSTVLQFFNHESNHSKHDLYSCYTQPLYYHDRTILEDMNLLTIKLLKQHLNFQ